MNLTRRATWTAVLDLHPHRLVLLLAAVLAAVLVQALIVLRAGVNTVELALFAVALTVLVIEATGIGAHFLTVSAATGWAWAGSRSVDGYTLLVALALLVMHVCLTLVTDGHPRAPIDGATAVRWSRRTGVVGILTGFTWLAAWSLRREQLPATAVFAVAALVTLTASLLWLRAEFAPTTADN